MTCFGGIADPHLGAAQGISITTEEHTSTAFRNDHPRRTHTSVRRAKPHANLALRVARVFMANASLPLQPSTQAMTKRISLRLRNCPRCGHVTSTSRYATVTTVPLVFVTHSLSHTHSLTPRSRLPNHTLTCQPLTSRSLPTCWKPTWANNAFSAPRSRTSSYIDGRTATSQSFSWRKRQQERVESGR